MDFDKYYELLEKGGPGSGRKGHMGVTPDKSTRERNRQKAGNALQTSRDAKRIIAELDLDKEDLKDIRDYASAEGITPSQFIVNNKDHIKSNFNNKKDEAHDLMSQMKAPGVGKMAKGGPGSGKKGHKSSGKIEPKHFEPNPNLRDKNKDLDRITPEQSAERKRKKEEAVQQARKERLKERADAAHRSGNIKEYEKLITQVRATNPYKGNPASEAISPTSTGTKPAGEGKYGVEGGKYTDPASEGASAAMSDNRRANTEKYLEQVKTSLSLEKDPAERANFEKDIKDLEAELKLKKAGGEGSRGGKVVGHTKSGKPIYQGARDQKHSSFDKRDHLDSANHKYKLAEEYSKKLQDKIKGDPKFEGEKANKVRTFIKDTHEQAGHHQRIANSKGDHEESRMTTGGSLPASAISPKHAKALAAIKELRAKGDNETAKKVYNAYIRDNE